MIFPQVNIVSDVLGDIQVLGRITNNYTQTLEGVTVIAEFYDKSGRLVNVLDVSPSYTTFDPGDTAPFKAATSGTKAGDVGSIILGCGASPQPLLQPQPQIQPQQQNSSANTTKPSTSTLDQFVKDK